ncbi:MAG: undecaprenyl/decaprenyl-phosphate alpha-N-acetylglucosaminyl 1-phosphate transferase [Flavobacteriales bacterium]|nr:undecaprenyl/decaprenyl-phosphate alpha-N-acetylglucosaminyl 1-phosphate transferase [Flavobacteriales bacterium]
MDFSSDIGMAYLVFFLITALFSFLINSLFLKFSKNLGMRNEAADSIRWATESKPSFGGISFYILFLLSVSAFSILFDNGAMIENKQLVGLVLATTLAFLMGLADDAYNTIPLLKFSTQVCCGLILIYSGTYIELFASDVMNYGFTLFWIVAIMNAMNLLDNMDAISGVVSVFIILSAMLIIYVQHDLSNVYFLLLLGVLSGVLGFLYFNWYPSKIYMGDTGSQFLGLFLGVIGIVYFWNLPENLGSEINRTFQLSSVNSNSLLDASRKATVALLVFIIPIVDTTTVFINRISKGTSPFVGGKDHTTHHLFYLGLSDKKVAMLFISISLVSLLLVYLIVKHINPWGYTHLAIFSAYILLVFGLLFYTTKISTPKSDSNKSEL